MYVWNIILEGAGTPRFGYVALGSLPQPESAAKGTHYWVKGLV